MKSSIATLTILTILLNLSACGTVLYPERKGQNGGDLDVNVVVLNGIGLLFFLVPGVIAYAVDFNNGSIYLPRAQANVEVDTDYLASLNVQDMQQLPLNARGMTQAQIENLVAVHSSHSVGAFDGLETYGATADGSPKLR